MRPKLPVFLAILAISNLSCSGWPNNLITPLPDWIKSHPFISAIAIVLLLQDEPWECVKETVSYFVEEHSVLCVIVLGLLLSGSFNNLSDLQKLGSFMMRYSIKGLSMFTKML